MTPALFMNINDTFAVTDTRANKPLPEGVECGSLRHFAQDNPNLIAQYYGSVADIKNPITALNTLFAQDGFYLRVKRGVHVEQPLQLVNILANEMPLMAVRRLLVIIEDNASAELVVCDHTQQENVEFLTLQTAELLIGKNADFKYYDLEESTRSTSRLSTLYLSQQADSRVTVASLTLFNGNTRNEFFCRFRGENADLKLYGLGIEDENRAVSVYSRIDHDVPHCHSNELFKYTVDDESRGSFTGMIYVAPGAVGTEAYQANRNLVGSEKAKIHTKPQLEIYNDDVKCSHGAAIGQLDEMQLFYLRTRGLSLETARLLLRQAFMDDVIRAVEIPALQDRLHMLVERRYAGADAACSSCHNCQ
jgi:Fe-S cluster assembly protein SufD